MFLKKYKPNTRGAVISCVKKLTGAHYHCAPVSSKKKSKEQVSSALYGTMLQRQTLQIFNLKTAARSESSGWKEKCLQAQLRSFAQKMKVMFQE